MYILITNGQIVVQVSISCGNYLKARLSTDDGQIARIDVGRQFKNTFEQRTICIVPVLINLGVCQLVTEK